MGTNKTIGQINKNNGQFNKAIQSQELESNNETNTYADKYKQILSVYDNKGEEKTSSIYEKKENQEDGYVRIYECKNVSALQPLNACAQQRILP